MVQLEEQGPGSSFWKTRKFFTTSASKDKKARISNKVRESAPRLARSGKACGLPTKGEGIESSAEYKENPKEAEIAPAGRMWLPLMDQETFSEDRNTSAIR